MNRLSAASFVPPSVYMGFRLFVLPKRRPGQLSTFPWGTGGTVVSWANEHAGFPTRPTPPRPEPQVVCPGLVFDK